MTLAGLVGAGVAIPASRLPVMDIHRAWQNLPESVVARLGVAQRAVVEPDVDAITLAAEAGRHALETAWRDRVDAVILGTQTNPYLSRSGAAIVADMLGQAPAVFATDVQFADKSGTAALLVAAAWVRAGFGQSALAIAADTLGSHAAPGDPLEYTAGAGAAAFVVAAEPGAATIERIASVASDTPDRFRVDGERHLRTTGSAMTATGVGMDKHALRAFEALGVPPEEVAHLAVTQPDAATPARIARRLRLPAAVVDRGLVAAEIGDAGSASCLLGLARVLAKAQEGEHIVALSYGAGAGSDAILLRATGTALDAGVERALGRAIPVDYPTAVRYERRYAGHERLIGSYE